MTKKRPKLEIKCFPVDGNYWFSKNSFFEKRHGLQHNAIDIFSIRGNMYLYPFDGEIVRVTYEESGSKAGNSVTIKSENGIYSFASHLDEVYAVEGRQVKAGNMGGKVGNSGNAEKTKPHVHQSFYTIYAKNKHSFLNPTKELLRLADPKLKSKIGWS